MLKEQSSGSEQVKLIFDFGLILKECVTHYAGLLCSVTVKKIRKKGNLSTQEITLAYGGRFDNNVANFQLELHKYLPASVGVTINCSEFASQIIELESSEEKLREQ